MAPTWGYYFAQKGGAMIKVFTTSQCAYCALVKKYLTAKGKEFEVINLDDQPQVRQELMDKTGAKTVPIVQVGEEFVVGWNPARLGALV